MGQVKSTLARWCRPPAKAQDRYRLDIGQDDHPDQPQVSKEQDPRAAAAAEHVAARPAKPLQQQPKKLDPKDFMFMNLQSTQQCKLPGSVGGQQFVFDGCQGCDLYVLDTCAMVTIDDCKDCRIFIGPTESSVFIRDCQSCSVACITRQLRTRDCKDCQLLLLCRTRPIIESSSNLAFGCLDTSYAGLAAHLAAAKLNPLHNFWSDVFDFTPAAAPGSNWSLLPAERASLSQLLGTPPAAVQQLLLLPAAAQTQTMHAQQDDSAGAGDTTAAAACCSAAQQHLDDRLSVVVTSGAARQQSPGACLSFLLVSASKHGAVLRWLAEHLCQSRQPAAAVADAGAEGAAASSAVADNSLVHTNEAAVTRELLQQMAAAAGWPAAAWQQLVSPAGAAGKKSQTSGAQPVASCIGLWVLSADDGAREQLCAAAAAQLGALCTGSDQAAKLFRDLGTDG